MLLSLLSVVVVLGCLVHHEAMAGPIPQAGSTLKYVSAVFRHGPRSPIFKYYPKHVKTDKHLTMFDGLRGVLTTFGKQRMYAVGQNLRERYGDFLGEYREDRVWVTSRGASRNVMTCLTIVAGMLPPKVQILADHDWQPIPVFATRDDKSHIFHDLEFRKLDECPKQRATAERLQKEVLGKVDWDKPIYRLLRSLTGYNLINSIFSVHQIYDTLHSEYMNGVPLPDWATEDQPSFDDLPLYPTLLRKVIEDWRKADVAKKLLNIYIGPFFYEMKEKLRRRSLEKEVDELMHLHVTEDTTMMALLDVLQIYEPNAYEPGNGLITELHYDRDTWIVKFFIYDSRSIEHNLYEVLPAFVDGSVCSLDTLFGVVLSPTWEDSCGP